MRRILALFMLVGIALSGCAAKPEEIVSAASIKSYVDIPGISDTEISDIERLVAERESFLYGHLIETEAFEMPNGMHDGFIYSYCALLTELFGIDFVPTLCEDWDELIERFRSGEIDFLGELTQTPERMRDYYMTYAIAERPLRIFTDINSPEISTEDDIEGMRIGVLEGTITAEYIRKSYQVQFEDIGLDSLAEAAEKLKAGEIDAFVMESIADPFFMEYGFIRSKQFFQLVYTPVSMSTANTELKSVITVMNKYLAAGGIDILYEMYQEGDNSYSRYKLLNSFTEEENAYLEDIISNGKSVAIGLEHDNYPYSFYNEVDKEFQGIAIDIIDEISSLTGIEFREATGKDATWSELLEKLRTGEISLVSQLIYSDERKNDFLLSESPYAASKFALVSKSDYPNLAIYQVIRSRAGYCRETMYADVFKAWFNDHRSVTAFNTQIEGFAALENGEIDLLMASEDMVLVQTNYREKSGYKVNISFDIPVLSYFGFHKDEELLCSIVSKAQELVNTSAIEGTWKSRVFDYSRELANQRAAYLGIFALTLCCILAGVILLLVKNNRLGKDLARQTARLSAIYTSMPDIVFSMDTSLRYTSCNPSFERFVGMAADEIIGKEDAEIFPNDKEMVRRITEINKKVVATKKTESVEETVPFPNGTIRVYEVLKTPLFQNDTLVGLLAIARDMTQRKEAEKAAQIASKAKSTFLAQMSHEIRTPMNAIIGLTNIAKTTDNPAKKSGYLDMIGRASQHLLGIINNILDMSKIESGKFELMETTCSIREAYNEVLVIVSHIFQEKNIRLITNFDETDDAVIICDKLRINQVLINLLGNAVKFTEEGGEVRLDVRRLEENENNIRMAFSVSDNGIGMSREQINRLFIPFEQGDKNIAARYGGTGLGLSISQNIVRMMGGNITVESEPDVGTTFCFELSFVKSRAVEDFEQQKPKSVSFEGKRIMLAEDIEINRLIIREILAQSEIEIVEAENGEEAVSIFAESPIGYFDLILMDIQMPLLDGYEATGRIRTLNRADSKSVPIISMTANAYSEDTEQAIASGMNGHLIKPINVSALMETLERFIGRQ